MAASIALKDLGGLIASATILSLSVELYLKSLRMILGMSIPDKHHLWSLYKVLPSNIRSDIEKTIILKILVKVVLQQQLCFVLQGEVKIKLKIQ